MQAQSFQPIGMSIVRKQPINGESLLSRSSNLHLKERKELVKDLIVNAINDRLVDRTDPISIAIVLLRAMLRTNTSRLNVQEGCTGGFSLNSLDLNEIMQEQQGKLTTTSLKSTSLKSRLKKDIKGITPIELNNISTAISLVAPIKQKLDTAIAKLQDPRNPIDPIIFGEDKALMTLQLAYVFVNAQAPQSENREPEIARHRHTILSTIFAQASPVELLEAYDSLDLIYNDTHLEAVQSEFIQGVVGSSTASAFSSFYNLPQEAEGFGNTVLAAFEARAIAPAEVENQGFQASSDLQGTLMSIINIKTRSEGNLELHDGIKNGVIKSAVDGILKKNINLLTLKNALGLFDTTDDSVITAGFKKDIAKRFITQLVETAGPHFFADAAPNTTIDFFRTIINYPDLKDHLIATLNEKPSSAVFKQIVVSADYPEELKNGIKATNKTYLLNHLDILDDADQTTGPAFLRLGYEDYSPAELTTIGNYIGNSSTAHKQPYLLEFESIRRHVLTSNLDNLLKEDADDYQNFYTNTDNVLTILEGLCHLDPKDERMDDINNINTILKRLNYDALNVIIKEPGDYGITKEKVTEIIIDKLFEERNLDSEGFIASVISVIDEFSDATLPAFAAKIVEALPDNIMGYFDAKFDANQELGKLRLAIRQGLAPQFSTNEALHKHDDFTALFQLNLPLLTEFDNIARSLIAFRPTTVIKDLNLTSDKNNIQEKINALNGAVKIELSDLFSSENMDIARPLLESENVMHLLNYSHEALDTPNKIIQFAKNIVAFRPDNLIDYIHSDSTLYDNYDGRTMVGAAIVTEIITLISLLTRDETPINEAENASTVAHQFLTTAPEQALELVAESLKGSEQDALIAETAIAIVPANPENILEYCKDEKVGVLLASKVKEILGATIVRNAEAEVKSPSIIENLRQFVPTFDEPGAQTMATAIVRFFAPENFKADSITSLFIVPGKKEGELTELQKDLRPLNDHIKNVTIQLLISVDAAEYSSVINTPNAACLIVASLDAIKGNKDATLDAISKRIVAENLELAYTILETEIKDMGEKITTFKDAISKALFNVVSSPKVKNVVSPDAKLIINHPQAIAFFLRIADYARIHTPDGYEERGRASVNNILFTNVNLGYELLIHAEMAKPFQGAIKNELNELLSKRLPQEEGNTPIKQTIASIISNEHNHSLVKASFEVTPDNEAGNNEFMVGKNILMNGGIELLEGLLNDKDIPYSFKVCMGESISWGLSLPLDTEGGRDALTNSILNSNTNRVTLLRAGLLETHIPADDRNTALMVAYNIATADMPLAIAILNEPTPILNAKNPTPLNAVTFKDVIKEVIRAKITAQEPERLNEVTTLLNADYAVSLIKEVFTEAFLVKYNEAKEGTKEHHIFAQNTNKAFEVSLNIFNINPELLNTLLLDPDVSEKFKVVIRHTISNILIQTAENLNEDEIVESNTKRDIILNSPNKLNFIMAAFSDVFFNNEAHIEAITAMALEFAQSHVVTDLALTHNLLTNENTSVQFKEQINKAMADLLSSDNTERKNEIITHGDAGQGISFILESWMHIADGKKTELITHLYNNHRSTLIAIFKIPGNDNIKAAIRNVVKDTVLQNVASLNTASTELISLSLPAFTLENKTTLSTYLLDDAFTGKLTDFFQRPAFTDLETQLKSTIQNETLAQATQVKMASHKDKDEMSVYLHSNSYNPFNSQVHKQNYIVATERTSPQDGVYKLIQADIAGTDRRFHDALVAHAVTMLCDENRAASLLGHENATKVLEFVGYLTPFDTSAKKTQLATSIVKFIPENAATNKTATKAAREQFIVQPYKALLGDQLKTALAEALTTGTQAERQDKVTKSSTELIAFAMTKLTDPEQLKTLANDIIEKNVWYRKDLESNSKPELRPLKDQLVARKAELADLYCKPAGNAAAKTAILSPNAITPINIIMTSLADAQKTTLAEHMFALLHENYIPAGPRNTSPIDYLFTFIKAEKSSFQPFLKKAFLKHLANPSAEPVVIEAFKGELTARKALYLDLFKWAVNGDTSELSSLDDTQKEDLIKHFNNASFLEDIKAVILPKEPDADDTTPGLPELRPALARVIAGELMGDLTLDQVRDSKVFIPKSMADINIALTAINNTYDKRAVEMNVEVDVVKDRLEKAFAQENKPLLDKEALEIENRTKEHDRNIAPHTEKRNKTIAKVKGSLNGAKDELTSANQDLRQLNRASEEDLSQEEKYLKRRNEKLVDALTIDSDSAARRTTLLITKLHDEAILERELTPEENVDNDRIRKAIDGLAINPKARDIGITQFLLHIEAKIESYDFETIDINNIENQDEITAAIRENHTTRAIIEKLTELILDPNKLILSEAQGPADKEYLQAISRLGASHTTDLKVITMQTATIRAKLQREKNDAVRSKENKLDLLTKKRDEDIAVIRDTSREDNIAFVRQEDGFNAAQKVIFGHLKFEELPSVLYSFYDKDGNLKPDNDPVLAKNTPVEYRSYKPGLLNGFKAALVSEFGHNLLMPPLHGDTQIPYGLGPIRELIESNSLTAVETKEVARIIVNHNPNLLAEFLLPTATNINNLAPLQAQLKLELEKDTLLFAPLSEGCAALAILNLPNAEAILKVVLSGDNLTELQKQALLNNIVDLGPNYVSHVFDTTNTDYQILRDCISAEMKTAWLEKAACSRFIKQAPVFPSIMPTYSGRFATVYSHIFTETEISNTGDAYLQENNANSYNFSSVIAKKSSIVQISNAFISILRHTVDLPEVMPDGPFEGLNTQALLVDFLSHSKGDSIGDRINAIRLNKYNEALAHKHQIKNEIDKVNKQLFKKKEKLVNLQNQLETITKTVEAFQKLANKKESQSTLLKRLVTPGNSMSILNNEAATKHAISSLANQVEFVRQLVKQTKPTSENREPLLTNVSSYLKYEMRQTELTKETSQFDFKNATTARLFSEIAKSDEGTSMTTSQDVHDLRHQLGRFIVRYVPKFITNPKYTNTHFINEEGERELQPNGPSISNTLLPYIFRQMTVRAEEYLQECRFRGIKEKNEPTYAQKETPGKTGSFSEINYFRDNNSLTTILRKRLNEYLHSDKIKNNRGLRGDDAIATIVSSDRHMDNLANLITSRNIATDNLSTKEATQTRRLKAVTAILGVAALNVLRLAVSSLFSSESATTYSALTLGIFALVNTWNTSARGNEIVQRFLSSTIATKADQVLTYALTTPGGRSNTLNTVLSMAALYTFSSAVRGALYAAAPSTMSTAFNTVLTLASVSAIATWNLNETVRELKYDRVMTVLNNQPWTSSILTYGSLALSTMWDTQAKGYDLIMEQITPARSIVKSPEVKNLAVNSTLVMAALYTLYSAARDIVSETSSNSIAYNVAWPISLIGLMATWNFGDIAVKAVSNRIPTLGLGRNKLNDMLIQSRQTGFEVLKYTKQKIVG
jgi:hypothetical protein